MNVSEVAASGLLEVADRNLLEIAAEWAVAIRTRSNRGIESPRSFPLLILNDWRIANSWRKYSEASPPHLP